MPTPTRVILAIDPGYDRMGWAVGTVTQKKLSVLGFGCVTTSASLDLYARFSKLYEEVSELYKKYSPNELALETLFFSKNQTTALAVSEVRGLLKATAIQHSIPVFEYQPNHIKIAVTGAGNANKGAVRKMVELQLKLRLPEKELDDTLDALALLITHSVSIQK